MKKHERDLVENAEALAMHEQGSGSVPHGQTSAPAHEFSSSANMSNEVCYKSCSLHKSIKTASSNVIILYVLIRTREVQPIQLSAM